jgi:hypothetical protein
MADGRRGEKKSGASEGYVEGIWACTAVQALELAEDWNDPNTTGAMRWSPTLLL